MISPYTESILIFITASFYDSLRFVNGTNVTITSSGNALTINASGSGTADGQDADSIMGERVDTVGRKVAGKRTASVWDQDSLKYKHYLQPKMDTTAISVADSDAYMLSISGGKVVIANVPVTPAQLGAKADSSTVLYWPDTSLAGGIATQADISVKLTATEPQVRLSVDTTLIDAAHVGLAMATDTALFRPTYYYPAMYHTGTDTLVITEIPAVGQGSPNLTLKMAYHATIYSGSATEINTSALTVNGTTTGQTATIANAKVPPGVYIWFTLPSVTAQPTALNVTAHGYRITKR